MIVIISWHILITSELLQFCIYLRPEIVLSTEIRNHINDSIHTIVVDFFLSVIRGGISGQKELVKMSAK